MLLLAVGWVEQGKTSFIFQAGRLTRVVKAHKLTGAEHFCSLRFFPFSVVSFLPVRKVGSVPLDENPTSLVDKKHAPSTATTSFSFQYFCLSTSSFLCLWIRVPTNNLHRNYHDQQQGRRRSS